MRTDHVYHIGRFTLEVGLTDNEDAIAIVVNDGGLVAVPKFANGLEVRPELLWDQDTKIGVVAHMLRGRHHNDTARDLAKRIVDALEGKKP